MFCEIHILSATTTAEALHFSIQELAIVQFSGHVQVKFCGVFLCKENFVWLFHAKVKFCVFFCGTMCAIIFFRSSVSATKISMKVLRIETKQFCTVQSNRNQIELFSDRQSTAERMCVFGRNPKAEMLSRTRLYKNYYNFSSLQFFNSKLGSVLCNSYSNRFCDVYVFPIVGIGAINFQSQKTGNPPLFSGVFSLQKKWKNFFISIFINYTI